MKDLSIFWWCRWYSLHIVCAFIFAGFSAFYPLLLQQGYLYTMVTFWLLGQVSGRVQTCLSLSFFERYRQSLSRTCKVEKAFGLQTPSLKTKHIHNHLNLIAQMERKKEILFFQLWPQILGFFLRIGVMNALTGLQWWSIIYAIVSILFIYSLSDRGKAIAKRHFLSQRQWYQKRYNQTYHYLHYGGLYQEPSFPRKTFLEKEWIKFFLGIWVMCGLLSLLYFNQNKAKIDTLLMVVSWMGLSDSIWALWQSLVDWMGLEKVSEQQEDQDLVETNSVVCSNLVLHKDKQPISFKVNPGEALWIKGSNGSGKTTLLRTLLSNDCLSGSIHISSDVVILSSDMIPRAGLLKAYLSPFSAELFGLTKAVEQLPQRMNTPIIELHSLWSKGMLQKLNLGWALQQKKKIFLLDEACCHIPIAEEIAFYKQLLDQSAIVLFTSHHFLNDNLEDRITVLVLDGVSGGRFFF